MKVKASDRTGGRSPPTSVIQSEVTVDLWNIDDNELLENDFDSQFVSTQSPRMRREEYMEYFNEYNKKVLDDVFGPSAYNQVLMGFRSLQAPSYLVDTFFAGNVFIRNNLLVKEYMPLTELWCDRLPKPLRSFVASVTLFSAQCGASYTNNTNDTCRDYEPVFCAPPR